MMRTYSRKRPSNQFIEDVHELCRLCLNKAMEVMPIFTEDTDNICATIALRIMICVGLEVKREECLPNIICTECYNELNKYYAFRKKCEVTYQKLKSHVLAVKEREYKQKLIKDEESKPNELSMENEDDMKFVVSFEKDQYADGVLNLNGVAQVNNFVEKYQSITKEDVDVSTEMKISNSDPQPSQDYEASDPDITTFLSTMLLELGILTQEDNGLVYSNPGIKTLELETGDGSQVTLELMEEDEQVDPTVQEQVQQEDTSIASEDVKDTTQDSDIIIKYITSNAPRTRAYTKNAENKPPGAWCEECGKRLASRSALVRHLRVHSGEKPFACIQCGRRFAQREVMVRHQLVHTEHRPYQCSLCDKSFTQRGALTSHRRQHAAGGTRPLALHRCDRCPKVFLYASGLSRHMMVHNGRVYICGACERQFKDKSSLLRHLKNTTHAKNNDTTT